MRGRDRFHYSVRLISVLMISAIFIVPSIIARQPSIPYSGDGNQPQTSFEPPVVKIDPQLRQLINDQASGNVKVIVLLRDGVDVNSVARIIGADGSLRLITTFSIIPAALIEGPLNRISELVSVKEIRSLYLNKEYRIVPMNETSSSTATRSLTSSWIQAINATPSNIANGSGVKVAIADSGIDTMHPDLVGKVIASSSFVRTIYGYTNDDLPTTDEFGHGTYVAGIVAGAGVLQPEYRGVASQAKLINSKCIDPFGRGFTAGIIKAIEWAVNMSADVINLSLGGGSADPDDPLSLAADSAVSSGTVVVASAGNEGPHYSSGSTPAAAKLAISVGAYNTSSSIASFSSRGPTLDGRPFPDLVAPGVDIISTLANPSSFYDYATRLGLTAGSYISLGGTSASAPFVSGAAALLLSATGLSQLNKSAVPPQSKVEIPITIRIALMRTAKSLGADVNTQGSGLIDIYSAYTYLLKFGARIHYPIVDVYPRELINPPYFIGYLGESLRLGVSLLTAFKANLSVAVSGNASSFITLANTTLNNVVGLTELKVNVSVPVGAGFGRYMAQIGFENTTTHAFLSGQNVSVSFGVGAPKGRLYFDLFHTDSSFSIMGALYKLASTLRTRGYSIYENDEPITYPKISEYDILVLTDPKTMFSPEEVNAVQRFVDNNGSLLILGSYYPDTVAEKVNEIIAKYGIQYDKNFVANYSDLALARAITSLINVTGFYGRPITSGISEYLYGYGSAITVSTPATPVSYTPHESGNLTVMAACDLPKGGRIVASGSLLFAIDDYVTSASYPGNSKLANNIFDWLLGKSNVSIETIVPKARVGIGESFQIGLAVTNRTDDSLLNSSVSCLANNSSPVLIGLKSNTTGIYYNMSIEFQTEGFYRFGVNATISPGGLRVARTFYVEVVNTPPEILNVTLSTYNDPAYLNWLPTVYRSFLPDGTPIILRHGDYINFTIGVSGLVQPDSNVTVYLTRSPQFYLANDKPLTYVSLRAKQIGSTINYYARYTPSTSNTTDVYTYWISADNAGHISTFNAVGFIMVAGIDPQIDNSTTTIDSRPLTDLATPQGLIPMPVYLGDTMSFVVNGSDAEENASNMKAYAILIDYDLYIVPGLVDSEVIVSQIPFNSGTGTFEGNLTIPASGSVLLPSLRILLSLPYHYYLILILLVDSDGAYSIGEAAIYVLPPRQPLFPPEVIFAILAASVAVPLLIILALQRRTRKRLAEGPPPDYYPADQPTKILPA